MVENFPIHHATPTGSRAPELIGKGRSTFVLDVVGAVIVATAISWSYVAERLSGGDATSTVSLYLLLAGGFLLGRLLGDVHPLLTPAVVAGSAAAMWLGGPLDFLGRDPNGYPFGYVNAKGAFLVQAAGAALMVHTCARQASLRRIALAAAIGFAVAPFVFRSLASGILGLAILVAAALGHRQRRSTVVAVSWGLVVMALTFTLSFSMLVPLDDEGPIGGAMAGLLSERRLILWHDAVSMIESQPIDGVGPERFEHESVTATNDEDARWVPNVFLEQGAEAGIPGMVLLLLLFSWGFVRLDTSAASAPLVAIGAASLAALGVHASMDYILHFPAVPLAASALIGFATLGPEGRR